jgi:hypothetical protein
MVELGVKRAREEDEDLLDQDQCSSSTRSPMKRAKSEDDSLPEVNQAQTSELPRPSDTKSSIEVTQTITTESSSDAARPAIPEVNIDINNVERLETLWHDNGDMILWVENFPDKTDALLFRVHRKILAESRMEPFCTAIDFKVPPEGTPGELFLDGVWVNKYEQQSPGELAIVLGWVYSKPCVIWNTCQTVIDHYPSLDRQLNGAGFPFTLSKSYLKEVKYTIIMTCDALHWNICGACSLHPLTITFRFRALSPSAIRRTHHSYTIPAYFIKPLAW